MQPHDSTNHAPSARHDGQIELLLNHYHEPFRPNDFRNLSNNQVDDAIVCYLVSHARKLSKRQITLVLTLSNEVRNFDKEQVTSRAFHDLFAYRSHLAKRQAYYHVPRIALLVALGLLILLTSHLVKELNVEQPIAYAVSDAIAVGGWVAMWSAFAGVFTGIFDCYRKSKLLRKLANAPIRFQYGTAAVERRVVLSLEQAAEEITTLLPQ